MTNQPESIRTKYGIEKANIARNHPKSAWTKPDLEVFGGVSKLTQGGPPGAGDSGAGALTQSPNFS